MNGIGYKIKKTILYILLILLSVVCMFPFLLMIVNATRSGSEIMKSFTLIPSVYLKENWATVFKYFNLFLGMWNSLKVAVPSTLLCAYFSAMTAYALARKDFEWRNKFSFFFYFTTLFSGGLVPYYILMTNTLGLRDNYLALLLPLLFSVYNLLIMKSYIMALPESLIDAAKIDGCSEYRTLFQIVMPLIKPALATVGLFIALAYWNDWYNAMLYIKKEEMYPLQYFLYQKINGIEAYKKLLANGNVSGDVVSAVSLPTQTLKMALTIVVTGPIVLAYPLVQRYFVQGITIGAVKG